jgi:serine/threonine protein kinase
MLGGDLKQFIKEHGGKPENLHIYMKLASDINMGLFTLHSNSHIHRDIAPKNIFLSGSMAEPDKLAAKLGDFGIAKAFS